MYSSSTFNYLIAFPGVKSAGIPSFLSLWLTGVARKEDEGRQEPPTFKKHHRQADRATPQIMPGAKDIWRGAAKSGHAMIDIVLVRFAVRYFNSNYPEDVLLVLGKDATRRDTGKSVNATI